MDILTFLGDVGGLNDALYLIGLLMTMVWSKSNFENKFVTAMFHFTTQPYLKNNRLEIVG